MSSQSLYAMYVIGQVESNHNWAAINPSDPITLGMMQWYGNRAKGLILLGKQDDPTGYNQYFAGTTAAHQAEADADMSYYYVNQNDEQAWHSWAVTDNNHKFQQAQWESDFTTYQGVCDSHGFPSQNIRERIFFMTMYHQSPSAAFRVLGSVSGTASLQLLHTTALNDSVLRNYPSRYNTAYDMLVNWDGTSAPPDFGQVGDSPATGGNPSGNNITSTSAQGRYISLVGDILQLHDGATILQFYRTGSQTWTNGGSAASTPISGGQTGGGTETGSGAGAKVVAWVAARVGKFAYSEALAGRLNPDQSGYTDCSGLWWRAYQDVTGVDVGTNTGLMATRGSRVAISSSDSITSAISKSKAGDLLLLTWSGHNPRYDHVEGMVSDGQDKTLSHGGPGNGPNYFVASQEMGMASEWEIRRYV